MSPGSGTNRGLDVRTHQLMDRALCGEPEELADGRARVSLETSQRMQADAAGLVHGGFVFSLADHAAMLAVNHPNVVLGSATTRFLAPVCCGDRIEAVAEIDRREGKKIVVVVEVLRGDEPVMTGEMICFTPAKHVLAS